jgi:hypothetical protein
MTITLNIEPKTRYRRKAAGEIIQPTQRSSIVEGAALALVLILCSLAQAATYYASPTGSGDGSDVDHPMAFSSVGTATSAGDTVHIIGMTEAIGHPDVDWPVGRLYYASYVCTHPQPGWTFDTEYRIGRFANNDFWVVGPVNIVGFSPACAVVDDKVRNGSQINPLPDEGYQGYDGRYSGRGYSADLNVADGVDADNPVAIPTGSTLISTVSRNMDGAIETPFARAVGLTVLASAPADGSFRPPMVGTDKTIRFNKSQLDYSLLSRLPTVSGQPTMSSVKGWFAGFWMDYIPASPGRALHTRANCHNEYGQYIQCNLGIGACMLHLDLPDAEKEQLLCRYLQVGIDYAAVVAVSRLAYAADGGHGGGRKYPLVLAAVMFDDPAMKALLAKTGIYCYQNGYGAGHQPPDYIAFGEDDQSFYVTQDEVTRTSGAWTGDTWTYYTNNEAYVDLTPGQITVGNTIVQEVTGATGTVLYLEDPTSNAQYPDVKTYYPDIITIEHTSGPDFDMSGTYKFVDQQDGGYFYTPANRRGRWNHNNAATWNPDPRGGAPMPYTATDIGLAEWGMRHSQIPAWDNRAFSASYKSNAMPGYHGLSLAALLTKGGKEMWQYDAMFDATARFMAETLPGGEGYGVTRSNSPFTSNMWDTYYTTYSDGIPADSDPPVQHRRIRIRATSNPN